MISPLIFRSILWHLLHHAEQSNRCIARLLKCSHTSVGVIRDRLTALKLAWSDVDAMSDRELRKRFYPRLNQRSTSKVEPNYEEIERQLSLPRKKRKTLAILYIEYRIANGEGAYKKTTFYQLIREHLRRAHCCMKQYYLPGEVMFVDFLGTKVSYRCRGKSKQIPVFVACLGFSKKLFTIATLDMSSTSWMSALVHAFEYFGGVPEVIQFDNAKAVVTKPQLLAVLNDNARALSEHYGCICDTSRVGTPTDNSNAENGAKIITQQILATMNQDLTFFSVAEINAHLRSEVERINRTPFQKQDHSRETLFGAKESAALAPLPPLSFIPFVETKTLLVPPTYHITYRHHEYSVPYTLVGQHVQVRVTASHLQAYFENKLVAKHPLSDEAGGFTRLTEHMKPAHAAQQRKNKSVFMAWAKEIGTEAEQVIEQQYRQTCNLSSRVIGKRCTSLQKLVVKYGEEVFIQACRFVLARESDDLVNPADIELVIRAKAYEMDVGTCGVMHTNVRGRTYYEGGHHEQK